MRRSRVLLWATLVVVIVAFSITPLTALAGPPPPPRAHYASYSHGCYSGCGHNAHGDWYKVRWGDTLAKIARWHGTSVWYLASINHIPNPNCIYAGQWLRVP